MQVLHAVRSEPLLKEPSDCKLLFRWFVGRSTTIPAGAQRNPTQASAGDPLAPLYRKRPGKMPTPVTRTLVLGEAVAVEHDSDASSGANRGAKEPQVARNLCLPNNSTPVKLSRRQAIPSHAPQTRYPRDFPAEHTHEVSSHHAGFGVNCCASVQRGAPTFAAFAEPSGCGPATPICLDRAILVDLVRHSEVIL
jgi:hypothetical protein